jgi:hypothetical protein
MRRLLLIQKFTEKMLLNPRNGAFLRRIFRINTCPLPVLLWDMVLFIQNNAQDGHYGRISVHFECARPVRGYDCYHGDKSCPSNLSSHHFMLTTETISVMVTLTGDHDADGLCCDLMYHRAVGS